LTHAVVAMFVVLSVFAKMVELMIGWTEKVWTADQVFESVFTLVQNVLTHAVVGMFVLLSVFDKIVELMIGCVENVCTADQVLACVFT
jgi:hypothetical protein